MKKFLITLGLILPIVSWADNLGFEVGATLWRTQMKGLVDVPISNASTLRVDLEKNLDMNTANNQQYYFEFYHPLPYLPNIILAANIIEHKGKGSPYLKDIISSGDNKKINLKGTININHFDVTGYWTPLDLEIVSLDAGLTYRKFDGDMNFILSAQNLSDLPVKSTFDKQYLLIYGKLTAYLPLTGLSTHVKLNAGHNFNFNSPEQAYDIDLAVNYRTWIGIGVSAGYRYFKVDLETDTKVSSGVTKKSNYKLDTYGPYVSLSYRF